jgi:hypothetical protein
LLRGVAFINIFDQKVAYQVLGLLAHVIPTIVIKVVLSGSVSGQIQHHRLRFHHLDSHDSLEQRRCVVSVEWRVALRLVNLMKSECVPNTYQPARCR